MESAPTPPDRMRPLGRSRTYTRADLPERLTHWHAPRANRWERLCVTAGQVNTHWLGASGATPVQLRTGDDRWIAPGSRWCVAHMDADARFELQVYAADSVPVSAPQPLRAALFDDLERVHLDDAPTFTRQVANLAAGDTQLLQGCFDYGEALSAILAKEGQGLFWHPLCADPGGFTAFIARSAQPVGLLDYLGRDHAVIEAALSGALRGDAEYVDWLHAVLGRHLAIEEQLLFPAYLKAGGRAGWIQGLINEHALLRQHLGTLANPEFRRRFLLLLDAHDEKEEQIVYPDILSKLDADATDLARSAMLYPPAAKISCPS